jgi:uncharacterized protein YkwD
VGPLAAALVGCLTALLLPPFPAATALASDEGRLLTLLGADRARAGLGGLRVADDLVALARRHSAQMVARQAIFHDPSAPDEVSGERALGEVVGRGPSADAVHRGFMGSPPHRAVLLGDRYREVGVGVAWGGSGPSRLLYVTELLADRGAGPRASPASRRRPAPRPAPPARHPPAPPPAPQPEPNLAVDLLLRMVALDG